MIEYAANIAIGYLLGSIPFGLVVGYLWLGRDIRASGSGKTGTTNVPGRPARCRPGCYGLRYRERRRASAHRPVRVRRCRRRRSGCRAAVVGHVWPLFAGFRRARCGHRIRWHPRPLAALALLFPIIGLALVLPTRHVSLMSVVGTPVSALVIAVAALAGWVPVAYAVYAAFAVAMIEYTHIPNIRRLLAGTEPRLGQGGDRAATG
jgi:glycerol-3-phosphate acyltransferase PlsY